LRIGEGEQPQPNCHVDFALGFLPERSLRVVEMLKILTGLDRFYFCATSTEAVMLARRLARAATGKRKIAAFRGSNHGQYDRVAATQPDIEDQAATWGNPPGCQEDLLLREYCQDSSLDIIARNRETLAAVLVEPFQTRHPELEPSRFLRDLQALAGQSPFLLILDELVSGFRLHPAGARGFLGIEATLVLCGKALSNGMPLAAVAGQRGVMDLLGGGDWQFGDFSRPALLTVPHGGTYHLHPLAMRSMEGVLERLVKAGPALQEKMSRETAAMIAALDSAPLYGSSLP
jgi:glutamate-1-semialdehyde aminotransferase